MFQPDGGNGGGEEMKNIIKEFDNRFPREKGIFWTPDYKGIIEFLRGVYFKGYRQGIKDSEHWKKVGWGAWV